MKGNQAFEMDVNYADGIDALMTKVKHYFSLNAINRPNLTTLEAMLYDGDLELLFLSNKPRTYENVTDDEKNILLACMYNARKEYGDKFKAEIHDENGNIIEVKKFDNEFIELLFN